jgi:hypothetical protein
MRSGTETNELKTVHHTKSWYWCQPLTDHVHAHNIPGNKSIQSLLSADPADIFGMTVMPTESIIYHKIINGIDFTPR